MDAFPCTATAAYIEVLIRTGKVGLAAKKGDRLPAHLANDFFNSVPVSTGANNQLAD